MVRLAPLILLLVSACGVGEQQAEGSSVTVKLPPPKDSAAPGFSSPIANSR